MKGKITLLVGGAVGYVLGTRAGRERYEQIKSQAQSLWGNPKVQEKASQAQDLAKEKGPEMGQKVAEAASGAAGQAKDKMTGGSSDSTGSASTAPYPTSASTGTGYPPSPTAG
jgi:hypothetical protein